MRLKIPSLLNLFLPFITITMAFSIGAILLLITGVNPIYAYWTLFIGAFGSLHAIAETLVKTTPFIIIGLGIAIAFKCKFWNIGAEGQLVIGAILATWIGIVLKSMPPLLVIPLAMILGFLGGALWAIMPALFKVKFGINDIITTLMMNYLATLGLNYLVRGPLIDPYGYGFPQSPLLPSSILLPKLIPGTRLHSGVLMALLLAIVAYIILEKSILGYKLKVVGENPDAARYSGINVTLNILISAILSGGLAGIAGMIEIYGVHKRLLDGISGGFGYIGIPIALVGGLSPIGIIGSALFFASLFVGADAMQRSTAIPINLVYAIEGLIMLFITLSEYLRRKYLRSW
ncbi:MAG: ABC transporter permease [Candidatus Bathyarchaeia archaeon]